ncbi:MAG: M23 family metallopeptidase [Chthoniobacterales bacterium]
MMTSASSLTSSLLLAALLLTSIARAMAQSGGDDMNLALPTENDAIFRGGGAQFYQYITRNFKGVKSTPWQGGQYGFVRDPVDTSGGLVYSRFHEGIDIKPVRRDASGEPLDEVRAIAAGRVVHTNLASGSSNYGRYVVVEHRWDGASYHSLYGHLASITVERGATVARGAQLGIMGHTGTGLDRTRAHLHLELNLLLSPRFESWYDHFIKNDPNRHGIYNGVNLTGIDIARFYLAQRKNPGLTVPQFLSGEDTFYKVKLPPTRNFDLPRRYPWLLRTSSDASPASWEVSFNNAGVPLKVAASDTPVDTPTISFVQKRGSNYSNYTRGVVTGSGARARFSESGQRLMRLLTWPD